MQGRRVVLWVYVGVVAVSAAVGAMVPVLLPEIGRPHLFFLVPLPATVFGYGAYGGLTTAAILGIGLLGVEAASRAETQ